MIARAAAYISNAPCPSYALELIIGGHYFHILQSTDSGVTITNRKAGKRP